MVGVRNQRGNPLATRLDTLRVARKVGGAAKGVEELQADIEELKTLVMAIGNRSTSYAPLSILRREITNDDYKGLVADFYSWPSPYVQDQWQEVLNVQGAGSLNYLSFWLDRRSRTFSTNTAQIRITVDGNILRTLSTGFTGTDVTLGAEYFIVGSAVSTVRVIQNMLYFAESLKIEVMYNQPEAPPSVSIVIHHQRY